MKKASARKLLPLDPEVAAAIKRFPVLVARKHRLAKQRKAFLKRTFGPLIKRLTK